MLAFLKSRNCAKISCAGKLLDFQMQFSRNCKARSNLRNEQLRGKCAGRTQFAQLIFAQFPSALWRHFGVAVAATVLFTVIQGGLFAMSSRPSVNDGGQAVEQGQPVDSGDYGREGGGRVQPSPVVQIERRQEASTEDDGRGLAQEYVNRRLGALRELAGSGEEAARALEFSEEGFDWRRDWWKYMLLALGSLLVLYFGIRLTRMLYRLAVFAVCVLAGLLGSFFLEPLLSRFLENRLPERLAEVISYRQVGYVAGFLACYLVASIVVGLLPKRLRNGSSS